MHYSDIVERALLRWLRDGETMTIDKSEGHQRELWLILRGLLEAKVVEIVCQDAQVVTYGLAPARESVRAVGSD